MKKLIRKSLIASLAILVLAGCAKNSSESDSQANQNFISAWILTHYPDLQPTGIGYYILPEYEVKGSGKDLGDDSYIFLEYTKTDLDGNITYSTDEGINRQLGIYDKGGFYGAAVLQLGEGYAPAGLEFSLKGLKVGAQRGVILPLWTNTTSRYDNDEDYKNNVTSGDNVIYKYKVTGSCSDIDEWQIDSLERYKKVRLNNTDSLEYGFYLHPLKDTTGLENIATDTTVYVNYIGRLLNGQVFDTTIKDTAKYYGIYNSGRTYQALAVAMDEDYEQITLDGSTTIKGFGLALSKMKVDGKVRCAFYSAFGYGSTGSSPRIPVYSPLEFEIELTEAPE